MKHRFWTISIVLALMLMVMVPAQAAPQLDNVTDAAELLTLEQWQTLEQQARDISGQYGVGVYIITVADFLEYTEGEIEDAADALYYEYTLGLGEGQDGILLLLSMAERDYILIAYGENAQYAFNDEGRAYMDDYFLDDFSADAWADGFAEYLFWAGDYLENAKNGNPYSDDHIPVSAEEEASSRKLAIGVTLLAPLVVAWIYTGALSSKMKSVAKAEKASDYMAGRLNLTEHHDIYTHTTETKRRIEKEEEKDDNSTTVKSSGGGSGTKGKF